MIQFIDALNRLLTGLFGNRNERIVKTLAGVTQEIEALEGRISGLSASELEAQTGKLRSRHDAGERMEALLPEALATLREASKRARAHRHFACQLMGGQVLSRGKIAEMRTGEGKTIVCHLAAYLKAVQRKRVHIITVNDYLVKRDAEFAEPIFALVGLSVGYIQSQVDPGGYEGVRQKAYGCDITYGTNNEFGFDYLRDNMKVSTAMQVQRGLDYAVIDEVDSILIDEARTPLIISGPANDDPTRYKKSDEIARRLIEMQLQQTAQTRARIEQKREELYAGAYSTDQVAKSRVDQAMDKFKVDPEWLTEEEAGWLQHRQLYVTDRERKSVHLTHDGVSAAQEAAGVGSFFVAGNEMWTHLIDNALRAHVVYLRDKDYVVERSKEAPAGEVIIVDEFTGRKMVGRQWSDGLHQAVEAKEGVRIKEETQTMATITLQNFFKLYESIAGMTGTAATEADEFMKVYKLDVVSIPTNKPMIRQDSNDKIYGSVREKFDATVEEIYSYHRYGHAADPFNLWEPLRLEARRLSRLGGQQQTVATLKEWLTKMDKNQCSVEEFREFYRSYMGNRLGPRPVLVGTTSVEKSEALSSALKKRHNVEHEVLNAKFHQREAEIVAKAGQRTPGRDGKPHGNVTIATNMAGRGTDILLGEGVAAAGGLHVVGTERHESRRVDNQLRGRAGRQGDAGSSRFFVSLEDDLMRLFAGEWTLRILKSLGLKDGNAIEDKRISRGIARAQRKVEERNFLIRKNLLDYDEVMDTQRRGFYGYRQKILAGARTSELIFNLLEGTVAQAVDQYLVQDFAARAKAEYARSKVSVQLEPKEISQLDIDQLDELIHEKAVADARGSIMLTIGEFLVEGEEPDRWDYAGLADWASKSFGVSLSISKLKQMQPEEIERMLTDAAIEHIEEEELAELEKFFDPDYPRISFCDYINAKYDLKLLPDAIRDQTADQTREHIVSLLRRNYDERQITYGVDFATDYAFGSGQANPYLGQWFVTWANQKYGLNWTLETLNNRRISEIRDEVIGIHRALVNGGFAAEVDRLLAGGDMDAIRGFASSRCGLPMDEKTGLEQARGQRDRLVEGGLDRLREELTDCERYILLRIIDQTWKDHLYTLEHLRTSVSLRGYAERDPKVEYKREGLKLYEDMWDSIRDKVSDVALRIRLSPDAQMRSVFEQVRLQQSQPQAAGAFQAPAAAVAFNQVSEQHRRDQEAAMAAQTTGKDGPVRHEPIRITGKVLRRNDACPCGSGKKFRKCCGEEGATPKFDLSEYQVK